VTAQDPASLRFARNAAATATGADAGGAHSATGAGARRGVLLAGAAGRMGQRICAALANHPALRLAAALEAPQHPALGSALAPGVLLSADVEAALAADADDVAVALCFAPPAATLHLLRRAAERGGPGLPCVVGTTGFDDSQRAEIEALAARLPLLPAANFSVAVNLLFHLAREAARRLGPGYDAEIVELHHSAKQDAPSGTALRLAAAVAEGRASGAAAAESAARGTVGADAPPPGLTVSRSGHTGPRPPGAIGVQALRGGDNPGEHTLLFLAHGERLELAHRATSRDSFARGALQAAEWLRARPPGLYDMEQVLGLCPAPQQP